VYRLLGVFQLLHVSDVAAGFNGEDKSVWCRISPLDEGRLCGQMIKGIIDLCRLEILYVVVKKMLIGQVLRIKGTFPVVVVPSRCPNMYRF